MDIKIGARFHNRFDFEVRDAITGELKNKYKAENILLDGIYAKLLSYSTYFSYIHFGTGTGALSGGRTALFTPLGNKSATLYETVLAYPTSRWTKTITLNASEYVGSAISEVGISDSSTGVLTHALIKDAEGNPITINKTELDVVIIYATIYLVFDTESESSFFTTPPSENYLLKYLTGYGMTTPKIEVGSSYINGGKNSCDSLILAKTATKTTDSVNKKIIYTVRFEVGDGNGDICELGLTNVMGCKLPSVDVFVSKSLTGVVVGSGDGLKTRFRLPNTRIDKNSLVVKLNGEPTIDYTTEDIDEFMSLTPHSSMPSNGELVYSDSFYRISDDGNYIATHIGSASSIYTRFFRRIGDSIKSLAPPSTQLKNIKHIWFDPEKKHAFYGHNGSGHNFGAYKIVDDTFILAPEMIDQTITSWPDLLTFSKDGTYFIHNRGRIYKKVGDDWVLIFSFLPGYTPIFVYISPDNKYFMVGSNSYFTCYEKDSSDQFVDVSASIKSVFNFGYPWISYNYDADRLYLASTNSPYGKVFKYENGSFSQLTTPSFTKYEVVSFNRNGSIFTIKDQYAVRVYKYVGSEYIAFSTPTFGVSIISAEIIDDLLYIFPSDTSPILIYKVKDDGLELKNSIPALSMPAQNVIKGANTDTPLMIAKYNISPDPLRFYSPRKDIIDLILGSPPAIDAPITADYTVPYIPKTNEYVLDVTFEIQFGEVV